MKQIAIVTYNRIGRGTAFESGWHEENGRRVLLLQNTKGEGSKGSGQLTSDARHEQIGLLWKEIQQALPELDLVVIYVGANGSQRAITLAAQLPASKVIFVGCDCGIPTKNELIRAAGLEDAQRLLCECGGHLTLECMYRSFMKCGRLCTDPCPLG